MRLWQVARHTFKRQYVWFVSLEHRKRDATMAIAKPQISAKTQQQLRRFFEETPPASKLLTTLRSRRVGLGYKIESGEEETHPVTGRVMKQERGPLAFASAEPVVPLSETEQAILCWSGIGPNGMVNWDIAVHGGFHELAWLSGRTAASPGNSFATDLIVINDNGVSLYNPGLEREKRVEIEGPEDYWKVINWFETGTQKISDSRPDIDWSLRAPGAPHATLFGPYQYNVNRPGTAWLIPITDMGWLYLSVLLNIFDVWHLFPLDDATQQPAGVGQWVREGQLEMPVPISSLEKFLFQVESYPPGSMVQNIRLAAEAMGLGAWIFCGFFDDILMGAYPDIAKGFGFKCEPLNPKAPAAMGALKIFGLEGVKEGTYVPSPRYKNGEAVIKHMLEEKYGHGATMANDDSNWVLTHGGPFKSDVIREIAKDPAVRVSDWAVEAVIAYIDYCVDRYGQCPVYNNSLECNFGVVVHHVDPAFYEKYYSVSGIPAQIHEHMKHWH
jgi:hypothetical protein